MNDFIQEPGAVNLAALISGWVYETKNFNGLFIAEIKQCLRLNVLREPQESECFYFSANINHSKGAAYVLTSMSDQVCHSRF